MAHLATGGGTVVVGLEINQFYGRAPSKIFGALLAGMLMPSVCDIIGNPRIQASI